MDIPNVVYIDMPVTLKSFIRANPDDSVTVVINSRLSFESQQERFKHELEHLAAGDLEHGGCADQIEAERHL